jgi:hypothetical protein
LKDFLYRYSRVVYFIFFLIFLAFLLTLTYIILTHKSSYTTRIITIQEGDTLWKYYSQDDAGMSWNEWDWHVHEDNHLTGFVQPGQKLEVPK